MGLSGKILEAAVAVHRALGSGFLQSGLRFGLFVNCNAGTLVVKGVVL